MESTPKAKELPLSVQFGALVALWLVWLTAVALVVWKDVAMWPGQVYADPKLIFALLSAGFPLVLVVTGTLFLLRAPPAEKSGLLPRALCWIIAFLTFAALAIFLTLGLLSTFALLSTHSIRE